MSARSSSGKTLRLELHLFGDQISETRPFTIYLYVYPKAVRNVIEGRKKSATVYAVEEE